jgi:acyl-CoA thioester hydrolase
MLASARSRPLEGAFRYRHDIEIRYVDTDALGHVNNATYFSYFEAARAGYYAHISGHAFGTGPDARQHTFVIAEAHITYRQPALFGEPLWCSCRVGWMGRSSFSFEYRIEVGASELGQARVVADGSSVQVFYDLERGKVVRMPAELRERISTFEGRSLPSRAVEAAGSS